MKEYFKQWLINQNSDFINGCGIECILSKLDDELNILPCNDPTVAHEEETETLIKWIEAFYRTLAIFIA